MEELDLFLSQIYGDYASAGLALSPDFTSHSTLAAPAATQPPRQLNPRSRCGRKPFGFYEGEAAVIRKMLELRALGLGFDRLAEQLNEESVRTRSGKAWHGRVVNRIIKAAVSKQ
jgi:hypothetical protein